MTERFLELLLEATARVTQPYFLLPVAGMANPIYRERVYCYELYHQLRILLDGESRLSEFSLCGEIDKQGHPIIGHYAPDFVFHEPGKMKKNLVVVEVKPINADADRIVKDRDTLVSFLSREIGYRLGIQLVYGDDAKISRFEDVYRDARLQNFQLLWHRYQGRPAERIQ